MTLRLASIPTRWGTLASSIASLGASPATAKEASPHGPVVPAPQHPELSICAQITRRPTRRSVIPEARCSGTRDLGHRSGDAYGMPAMIPMVAPPLLCGRAYDPRSEEVLACRMILTVRSRRATVACSRVSADRPRGEV